MKVAAVADPKPGKLLAREPSTGNDALLYRSILESKKLIVDAY